MIDKLYNLKKMQTEQKLMEKGLLLSKIEQIDIEILLTQNSIDSARVQKFGAISDFTILTIHKNTMKEHIKELENQKNILNMQLEILVKDIIEYQKETEQFKYILDEQKKERLQEKIRLENEAMEEFIQSKYISNQG